VRWRCERGGAAVEFVIVTPLLLVLLLFVVGLGRLGVARGDIDGAARDAARAASLARSFEEARLLAVQAATASLAERRVTCGPLGVVVEPAPFTAGGSVAVRVSCTVAFSDLTLVWTPGDKQVSSRFVAPIDAYRGLG
jgi:Flp pilus assembly protein TadG